MGRTWLAAGATYLVEVLGSIITELTSVLTSTDQFLHAVSELHVSDSTPFWTYDVQNL